MNLMTLVAFALASLMILAFAWQIFVETSEKTGSDNQSEYLSNFESEFLKKQRSKRNE